MQNRYRWEHSRTFAVCSLAKLQLLLLKEKNYKTV